MSLHEALLTADAHCRTAACAVAALAAEDDTSYAYTECRQVTPASSLAVWSKPCDKGSQTAQLPACTRVEFIVPAAGSVAGVTCPDGTCWNEVIIKGKRSNWVASSAACGSPHSHLASCPAAECPAEGGCGTCPLAG